MIPLTDHEQLLVDRLNAADKLNHFLFINPDCHSILQEQYPGSNRFDFVNIKNKIAREMSPTFHTKYNGKKCTVFDRWSTAAFNGVIKHNFVESDVYFINSRDEISLQAPTLWVVVDGDPHRTHTYLLKDITLCE